MCLCIHAAPHSNPKMCRCLLQLYRTCWDLFCACVLPCQNMCFTVQTLLPPNVAPLAAQFSEPLPIPSLRLQSELVSGGNR